MLAASPTGVTGSRRLPWRLLSLLVAYVSLVVAYVSLLVAYVSLLVAYASLPVAYVSLLVAYVSSHACETAVKSCLESHRDSTNSCCRCTVETPCALPIDIARQCRFCSNRMDSL